MMHEGRKIRASVFRTCVIDHNQWYLKFLR
uniref:Uncharacterized protein n=1 Tax=Rhizophora mucronata TaxID=61149 RepID=A0A2P2N4J2_RHIMU